MGIRIERDPWWVRHRTIGVICGVLIICVLVPIYIFFVICESVWLFLTGAKPETDYEDIDYEIYS